MPLADLGGLRELVAEGIGIGSHSWSHRPLPDLADAALREEVEESGDRLEQLLAVPVRHFAYPYGRRGAREVAAARGRYRTAVNAEPRLVASRADPHDLNRVDGHDLRIFVALELAGLPAARPYFALRRQLRGVRRRMDGWLGRL
jgi:peptidoglycan/xylan/chitin deacetylase (PgdA/CDA1 family)